MAIRPFSALLISAVTLVAFHGLAVASGDGPKAVPDETIAAQRAALAKSTDGVGYGPQSPRDISKVDGTNLRTFEAAPDYTKMNLCDIHFHKNAEHRGGEFTKYAGNGDGSGFNSGYQYSGTLSEAELAPLDTPSGAGEHGVLEPGDTIEVHFVFSSAQAKPGPTLGTCLSDAINNPQLRVDAHVMVLVNDENAVDFGELAKTEMIDGLHHAPNIPKDTGAPVHYSGSTTGPDYNEKGSPLQVSWSVHPKVLRVDIRSVLGWLGNNVFNERYAHGVRNLVINPDLLSAIKE